MERIIVEYLANAVWQIPLLAAGVGALLWALGSDVQTRHRVWLAVLAVAVLMPLRGMETTPEITSIRMPSPSELNVHSIASDSAMPLADIAPAALAPMVIYTPPPAAKSGLTIGPVATRWLVRLYLGALLFAGWRITRAWFAAQGLLRRSRSIHLAPRAMAIFAQAAERQDIALPRLRQSDETVSPVVIGARRPVLLLPAGFDQLKDDEILAALSHEFAHLARRDYLINLICQIAALPISWHPATHFVQKRISDTREMLCDAVAADEMASPVRYATCLVAFAFRALDNHKGALATQGLSMFDNRILEERILQLTQEPKRPEPRTRLARLAGASVGLVMSVTLALLFHITPTLADAADAIDPPAPVELTPPAELPAPEAPVSPTAPIAPVAPVKPTVVIHQHAHTPSEEIQRGIAEEKRQQADRQREAADRQREDGDRQREIAEHQRERAQELAERERERAQELAERERDKARDRAQHDRDAAQAQRDAAQAERDAAHAKRDAEREAAQAQREALREVAEAQREAAHEAAQAAREAGEEARHHADEIKRQVAAAIKANEAAREIDMDAIRKEVSAATANVNGPEFKAQMAELQAHMQKLHANMSELREHMKEINKEMEKSLNSPM